MNTTPRVTKSFYILFCLLVILAGLYLVRSWVRSSVIPAGYNLRYKSQLQSVLDTANDQLQPAKKLDLKTVGKAGKAACHLSTASGLKTEVYCFADTSTARDIPASGQNAFSQQALDFNQQARAYGWTGGDRQNDLQTPSRNKLNNGDYLLIYYKKIKGFRCTFQLSSDPNGSGGSYLTGLLSCVK